MSLPLAAVIAVGSFLPPQSPRPEALDAHVQKVMAAQGIPALQLAVMRDGKLVTERAYGMASIELAVPATTGHVFMLASVTKTFTAVAVMQFVQDGKLSLDQTLGELMPDVAAAWRPVTVRHLLSHTSGLPDVLVDPFRGTWLADQRDDALAKAAAMPLQAEPGAGWSYNQTNYVLLGMLLEKLGGAPFAQVIRDRVLAPHGLEGLTWGDSSELVPHRVSWYSAIEFRDGQPRRSAQPHPATVLYPVWLRTAAGLNGNARDLARFADAVASGRLLDAKTRDLLWTAVSLADGVPFRFEGTLGMGLGWLVDDRADTKAAGGTGGSGVAFRHYAATKLTVAVLTNLQGVDPDALVDGIAALFLPAAK